MEKMTVRRLLEQNGVEKDVPCKIYEIDGGLATLVDVQWYMPDVFEGEDVFMGSGEGGTSYVLVRITDKDELVDALYLRVRDLVNDLAIAQVDIEQIEGRPEAVM